MRTVRESAPGRRGLVLAAIVGLAVVARGQEAKLAPEVRQSIDRIAQQGLSQMGAPSASVAVVKDGQIVYVHAYGKARIEPPGRRARRCAIASVPSASNSRRQPFLCWPSRASSR